MAKIGVRGVYNKDPRKFDDAIFLEELTTEERDKIEEHIVEFMNEMKHEDKDLLIEAA